MPFAWAARISARAKPNVQRPRAGRAAAHGEEREAERDRVGEHVPGVGEERERVGDDPRYDLERP